MYDSIPKEKIIKAIEIFFPEAIVYLFGSRARNEHTERSDIDLAIDIGRPMTLPEKGRLIGLIDALGMAQKTDVVDLHRAPQALKENILREGIIWKS